MTYIIPATFDEAIKFKLEALSHLGYSKDNKVPREYVDLVCSGYSGWMHGTPESVFAELEKRKLVGSYQYAWAKELPSVFFAPIVSWAVEQSHGDVCCIADLVQAVQENSFNYEHLDYASARRFGELIALLGIKDPVNDSTLSTRARKVIHRARASGSKGPLWSKQEIMDALVGGALTYKGVRGMRLLGKTTYNELWEWVGLGPQQKRSQGEAMDLWKLRTALRNIVIYIDEKHAPARTKLEKVKSIAEEALRK